MLYHVPSDLTISIFFVYIFGGIIIKIRIDLKP